jgi:N-acetylglucosaminyldiphosphoundecaprenol N-acetyl-beta-D-mannosaminyltransferase
MSTTHSTRSVFGITLSTRSMDELVDDLLERRPPGRLHMVVTMNLDHVVRLRRNENFRAAYRRADVVTADGVPVFAYARMRGVSVHKVSGSDLFVRLMERLQPGRHRCFFVLSSEKLGKAMLANLAQKGFASDQVAFAVPPFGFEDDGDVSMALAQTISAFVPSHLFICVGAPKSEIWCCRHSDALTNTHAFCVGAAAEFYLGLKRRAPVFMQLAGLEWLWRFGQEPRRMGHRYFIASWGFFGAVRDDLADAKRQRRRSEL